MAEVSTPLCSTLGIEYPLIQAPIGSVSTPALAAAVSEAGGFGTLAVTWRDLDGTREAIRQTKTRTDTFGVNLVLDEATRQRPTAEHLEACLEAGVSAVSFSFGDPTPHLQRCREAGVKTLVSVGSAAMAREVVDAGADVVVAQGWEAGGHVQSEVATLPLVPRVVDAVPETPVVTAGGIADGRGVAAVLALGADGAWLGTRFVATAEADAHESYKRAIVEGRETETALTELFDGGWPDQPHRTLENETVEDWREAGRPAPGSRPGEDQTVAQTAAGEAVDRYDDLPPLGGMEGDLEALPQYAGQSAGLTDDIRPAAEVVDRLVTETVAAGARLDGIVDRGGNE